MCASKLEGKLLFASIILIYVYRCFPPFHSWSLLLALFITIACMHLNFIALPPSRSRNKQEKRLLMRLLRGDMVETCGEPSSRRRRLNCSKINTQSLAVVGEAICDIEETKIPFQKPINEKSKGKSFCVSFSTRPESRRSFVKSKNKKKGERSITTTQYSKLSHSINVNNREL